MTGLAFPKPDTMPKPERGRIAQQSKQPVARERAVADRLCGALVKASAGNRCEAVGYAGLPCSRVLDWAHGIRRRKALSIRWAHTNGFAICRAHHRFFSDSRNADEWRSFRVSKVGELTVTALEYRSQRHERIDLAEVVAALRVGVFIQGGRA